MVIISSQTELKILIAALFVSLVFLILLSFSRYRKKILVPQKSIPEFRKEPVPQNRAVFVDLSPKSADMVELAVEVWRINNRIMSANNNLTDIQKRGLESSVQKLIKFLDHNEIKIVDHTGEKYNEGMNIDVLSFEKDPKITIPMIKETIEPSIICRGHVIKKGKIIVTNN